MIVLVILIIVLLILVFMSQQTEPFIVADAQDFQNYNKLRARTTRESNYFKDQTIPKTIQYDDIPPTLDKYMQTYCCPDPNRPFYEFIGYNYTKFGNMSYPTNIDKRILSQTARGLPSDQLKYKNIPVGYNSAFTK